jgi:hypothetical protein
VSLSRLSIGDLDDPGLAAARTGIRSSWEHWSDDGVGTF